MLSASDPVQLAVLAEVLVAAVILQAIAGHLRSRPRPRSSVSDLDVADQPVRVAHGEVRPGVHLRQRGLPTRVSWPVSRAASSRCDAAFLGGVERDLLRGALRRDRAAAGRVAAVVEDVGQCPRLSPPVKSFLGPVV